MKLTISGLGGKHVLDAADADTVRVVKARLEPLTGLAAAEMKLLVKGKAPSDDATCAALGLADGAKLMLMRSQLGAKLAQTTITQPSVASAGGASWLCVGARVQYQTSDGKPEPAVIRQVHTDEPTAHYYTIVVAATGAERQTPADRLRPLQTAAGGSSAMGPAALAEAISAASAEAGARSSVAPPTAAPVAAAASEAGSGSVTIVVSQGRRQLSLHAEPSSTVRDLKGLLESLNEGSSSGTMKLLVKGKEATDGATVDSLGFSGGGRMMLLFRERHHRQAEGAAVVTDCSAQLGELRGRLEKTRHRMTKRLLTGAEALAALGELDGELELLALDLRNAAPAEGSEAGQARARQLEEIASLKEELAGARSAEAQAELLGQLGR